LGSVRPRAQSLIMQFTASGDISQITPAVTDEIASHFATTAGVARSNVLVTITASSVRIDVAINLPSVTADEATTVASTFYRLVRSPAAATAFFAAVESAPITIVSVDTPPTATPALAPLTNSSASLSEASTAEGPSTTLPVIAIVMGTGGLIAFVGCAFLLFAVCRAVRARHVRAVVVSSSTSLNAPSCFSPSVGPFGQRKSRRAPRVIAHARGPRIREFTPAAEISMLSPRSQNQTHAPSTLIKEEHVVTVSSTATGPVMDLEKVDEDHTYI